MLGCLLYGGPWTHPTQGRRIGEARVPGPIFDEDGDGYDDIDANESGPECCPDDHDTNDHDADVSLTSNESDDSQPEHAAGPRGSHARFLIDESWRQVCKFWSLDKDRQNFRKKVKKDESTCETKKVAKADQEATERALLLADATKATELSDSVPSKVFLGTIPLHTFGLKNRVLGYHRDGPTQQPTTTQRQNETHNGNDADNTPATSRTKGEKK